MSGSRDGCRDQRVNIDAHRHLYTRVRICGGSSFAVLILPNVNGMQVIGKRSMESTCFGSGGTARYSVYSSSLCPRCLLSGYAARMGDMGAAGLKICRRVMHGRCITVLRRAREAGYHLTNDDEARKPACA